MAGAYKVVSGSRLLSARVRVRICLPVPFDCIYSVWKCVILGCDAYFVLEYVQSANAGAAAGPFNHVIFVFQQVCAR